MIQMLMPLSSKSSINELVKARKVRVYHGLVLRNSLEQAESHYNLKLGRMKAIEEE